MGREESIGRGKTKKGAAKKGAFMEGGERDLSLHSKSRGKGVQCTVRKLKASEREEYDRVGVSVQLSRKSINEWGMRYFEKKRVYLSLVERIRSAEDHDWVYRKRLNKNGLKRKKKRGPGPRQALLWKKRWGKEAAEKKRL